MTVDLITQMATEWLPAESCSMEMLGKGVIHVLAGMEQDGRFHQATQNDARSKTYDMFTSGIFHLIFSDCGQLQVSNTTESKTMYKGGLV